LTPLIVSDPEAAGRPLGSVPLLGVTDAPRFASVGVAVAYAAAE